MPAGFNSGGPEGIRTHDLSDANRTLSQLSYRPNCLIIIARFFEKSSLFFIFLLIFFHTSFIITSVQKRRCDGIGRRAGLKIRLPLSRADARNPLFYKGFQNLKKPIFGLCPPKCPPISGKRAGTPQKTTEFAGVMELADVLDSKSNGLITRAGSTPATGTIRTAETPYFSRGFGVFYPCCFTCPFFADFARKRPRRTYFGIFEGP